MHFLEIAQKLVQKPFNQNIDRYLTLSKTPPKNLFYCILIQLMHGYCIFIHDNTQTLKTILFLSPALSVDLNQISSKQSFVIGIIVCPEMANT